MVITALLVVACAGAGSVARFIVDGLVQSRHATKWPLGTLVVNVGGAFVLGLLNSLDVSARTMLILGTATVGSYTTFSTWMIESHRPATDGERAMARRNIALSLAGGLCAVALGAGLGSLL